MTKASRIREAWAEQQASKTEAERRQEADETSRSAEALVRDTADKVRENRLRRMAERQGLKLEKSRRRDPRAADFGRYWLTVSYSGERTVVFGATRTGAELDQVEEYLTRDLTVEDLRRLEEQVAENDRQIEILVNSMRSDES